MSWEVKIQHGGGFTYKVYVYQLLNNRGDMDIVLFNDDGTSKVVRSPAPAPGTINDPPPSMVLNYREGHEILKAFASELASHGFSTLDPGGVAKAKDAHIASLERQAERLFTLANGTNEVRVEHAVK